LNYKAFRKVTKLLEELFIAGTYSKSGEELQLTWYVVKYDR